MKSQTISNNGITHVITVGKVIVDGEPYVSQFQKEGTLTAMLRQVINDHATYPSSRVSDEKKDNLFDDEEFNFGPGQEFDSVQNRVAFMDVPEGTTAAVVMAKLKANPTACIYKCLSNRPILTSGQASSITAGLRTYDQYANSQAIRYPETEATLANGTAGKLILDAAGKVQYRATFFSKVEKADEDERGTVPAYLSPELIAELKGTPANASLVPDQQL